MSGTARLPLARLKSTLDGPQETGVARLERDDRFGGVQRALAAIPVLCLLGLIGLALTDRLTASMAVVLGLVALAGLAGLLVWSERELLAPMRALRGWAVGMCSGDLSTRLPAQQAPEFARLAFHVNRLSGALDMLANEMDDTVSQQTERLEQRNQAIAMLYEVASTLNERDELRSLLKTAADKLVALVDGTGAVLRNLDDAGDLLPELNVLVGFEDVARTPALGPVPPAVTLDGGTREGPAAEFGYSSEQHDLGHVVRIPLRYGRGVVGFIDLFMQAPPPLAQETGPLFDSVGKHLGMAIEKARLDDEARTLLRVRERTALGHELHDSLAQTIAGLRLQVRLLEETLVGNDLVAARGETQRIAMVVEEAHTELRELLANFTAPIDDRGIKAALEELVERARRDNRDASIFLQMEGDEPRLSANAQVQAVRIVGEALANARKHARAHVVRVMMRYASGGAVNLLVEDDGVGMGERVLERRAGENLGLSIMHERAQRAGGKLLIESEPGEGTRVELRLPAVAREGEN